MSINQKLLNNLLNNVPLWNDICYNSIKEKFQNGTLLHGGIYMKYKVYDNIGNVHSLIACSDDDVLSIMKKDFINYIVSVLSSDPIVVVRPNGYILAYINTSTGSQTVKSMSDWRS